MIGISVKEKILVTGGTGFLGSLILDNLLAKDFKPIVVVRNSRVEFLKKYQGKVDIFNFDLLDFDSLEKFFVENQPTEIIHLAGGKKNLQSDSLENINFAATVKLLELARKTNVRRTIIIGTADEYGFQKPPQREEMAAEPVSEYALSKNKAVNFALSNFAEHNLPVVILRPFTIYGVRQPSEMFVSQAVECAVGNLPFEMSEGFQKRDLVFETDFADAMMKALTVKNIEGEIFNVGSGKAVALRELAKKIWKIAGADPSLLKIGARATNRNELHDTEADISKIQNILGWKPQISLDEGLKKIIESRRKKLNER